MKNRAIHMTLLGLSILAASILNPAPAMAEITLNQLTCALSGQEEVFVFEFKGESLHSGVYSVMGSFNVLNSQQVVASVPELAIEYRIVKFDPGALGGEGRATGLLEELKLHLADGEDVRVTQHLGQDDIIYSSLGNPAFHFPAGKRANCSFNRKPL